MEISIAFLGPCALPEQCVCFVPSVPFWALKVCHNMCGAETPESWHLGPDQKEQKLQVRGLRYEPQHVDAWLICLFLALMS